MIIKKTAVGNNVEAFVENGYVDGINIISSDDNNKGKTIAIQSMMYALGNEPTFPTTFDYKNYYHYVEFVEDGTLYRLCRSNDSFILKYNSVMMIFDSVSELKRYWTKYIFRLPQIVKNQITKIVDPVLFFQLFFVGQDKKDTSNISHHGLYNKQDYINMLFDICDASGVDLDEEEIKRIKEQIKSLKDDKEILLKQHQILISQKKPVSYLSTTNDRTTFSRKLEVLEKVNAKITELRKSRNAAATRKGKWETTLKELRSLNRTIESGELRCMDCDSTNISFNSTKKNGYSFDVSSVAMRNEIVESIKEKIALYQEEIDKYSALIAEAQDELNALLSEDSISLEALVAYKEEVFSAADAEKRIQEIEDQLANLKSQLQICSDTSQSKKDKQNDILGLIIQIMNDTYHLIDPNGNLMFESLFTKRDETYSGSEATVFHLVKLYSICRVLNHNYPIVVDSFRAEDLSTPKEAIVIDLYSKLPNQVIFTTTLKTEELGKYDSMNSIHHIDYKDHAASKMLTPDYLPEFLELMSIMTINLERK